MAGDDVLRFDDVVKAFGGTRALKGVSLAVGARRGRRAAGRERRRQVHPDQDPGRHLSRPTAAASRSAASPTATARQARGERQQRRLHPPGSRPRRMDDRGREHEPGAGLCRQSWSGALGLIDWRAAERQAATALAAGRLRHRPDDARPQPQPHREIARRHRPRAGRRLRLPRARRADRQPAGRRGRAAVRGDAAAHARAASA